MFGCCLSRTKKGLGVAYDFRQKIAIFALHTLENEAGILRRKKMLWERTERRNVRNVKGNYLSRGIRQSLIDEKIRRGKGGQRFYSAR